MTRILLLLLYGYNGIQISSNSVILIIKVIEVLIIINVTINFT